MGAKLCCCCCISGDAENEDQFEAWKAKWKAFFTKTEKTDPAFQNLLELYAHEYNVVRLSPAEVRFYCLELANLLAQHFPTQDLEKRAALEALILQNCEISLTLSHKLFFFFRSFCSAYKTMECGGADARPLVGQTDDDPAVVSQPFDRCVRWKGSSAAQRLADHFQSSMERYGVTRESESISCIRRPSPIPEEPESILLPPASSMLLRDDISKEEEDGALEQKRGVPPHRGRLPSLSLPSSESLSLFDATPRFIDGLVALSSELLTVRVDLRNSRLRAGLMSLQQRCMPCESLYIPVGNSHHRILSILPTESFVFNTKNRVPIFVTLEVVDYADPDGRPLGARKRSKSSKFRIDIRLGDRHWRLGASSDEGDEEGTDGLSEERASAESTPRLSIPPEDGIPYTLFDEEGTQSEQLPRGAPPEQRPRSSTPSGRPLGQWSLGRERRKKRRRPRSTSLRGGRGAESAPRRSSYGSVEQSDLPRPFLQRYRSSDNNNNATTTTEDEQAPLRRPRLPSGGGEDATAEGPTASIPRLCSDDDLETQLDQFSREQSEAVLAEEESPDPSQSVVVFPEPWKEKQRRFKYSYPSTFTQFRGWRLLPIIVKAGDDLRQEQIVSHLASVVCKIFRDTKVKLFLRQYDIIATSKDSGVIEAIPDTISLHALRKNDPHFSTLRDFYVRHFGGGKRTSRGFQKARKRFVESLAAMSLFTYLLSVKDRHDSNILVDFRGHVIQIDYGFFLNSSPGGNWNFERVPFKLTKQFVELMGDARSKHFRRFRALFVRGFLACRKHQSKITLALEMLMEGNERLPCFASDCAGAIAGLRGRFFPELSTRQCFLRVNELIDESIDNWRTRWYDRYQRCCVGIS